ncbi:MAG: recombination protein O N-terminal domain-containing protein [Patescibacteria group bacterium]
MYRKHHTRGIVVSGKIEGDSNKRINIFTENFGLINARVQGSRNIHSKLRGGSQDFSFGEFSLVHGKSGWRVVSARADKNLFEAFRNSPAKLKIVSNILNLIKKLVSEEAHISLATAKLSAKSGVFNIVYNFFTFLEKVSHFASSSAKATLDKEASRGEERNEIILAECLTLIRILHILGYMRHDPELSILISSYEINIDDLETIAPRRSKMVALINESLKAV